MKNQEKRSVSAAGNPYKLMSLKEAAQKLGLVPMTIYS
jgi:hypothetical protein